MKKVKLLLTLFLLLFSTFAKAGDFTVGNKTFLLNGEPFIVKAAEVHYPRMPRPYWDHRIKMCKSLGMNTLCIYVFWNIHEQREGEFDFSGVRIRTCKRPSFSRRNEGWMQSIG